MAGGRGLSQLRFAGINTIVRQSVARLGDGKGRLNFRTWRKTQFAPLRTISPTATTASLPANKSLAWIGSTDTPDLQESDLSRLCETCCLSHPHSLHRQADIFFPSHQSSQNTTLSVVQGQERPFHKSKAKSGKEAAQQQVGSSSGLPGRIPSRDLGGCSLKPAPGLILILPKAKGTLVLPKHCSFQPTGNVCCCCPILAKTKFLKTPADLQNRTLVFGRLPW